MAGISLVLTTETVLDFWTFDFSIFFDLCPFNQLSKVFTQNASLASLFPTEMDCFNILNDLEDERS